MKNFSKILKWMISKFFTNLDTDKARSMANKWLALLARWIRTKGIKWTIKRIKLIRLVVTRYLAGSPLNKVDDLLGIQAGFPKSILFIKEELDSGDPIRIRFVITLLVVSRAINAEGEPDYSSITAEFSGDFKTIDKSFVERFVKDFDLELFRQELDVSTLDFTMKGGPKGQSLLTSVHSIKDWDGPRWAATVLMVGLKGAMVIKDLWMGFRDQIKNDHIEAKMKIFTEIGYSDRIRTRRLSLVRDPELKVRVIGIVDYFSQQVLAGLSDQLFTLLRKFSQDRTFTQDPHIAKDAESKFHSFDLKNATDRFPLKLQQQLLAEMLGGAYAAAWGSIMTHEPFAAPNGDILRYEVGQPMGAKSSWAMFTLSHHMLVQYAAFLAGCYPTKKYILLGDDIVITDDKVAAEYVKLCAGIGVEISAMKTHVSLTTYEFAKRWFHHGVEVSGYPVSMIVSTLKAPLETLSGIIQLSSRGYSPSDLSSSVEAVICLHKFLNVPVKRLRHMRNLLQNFHFTLRNLHSLNYEEVRLFMANATKNSDYVIPAQAAMLESELSRVASAVANGSVILLVGKLSRYEVKLRTVMSSLFGDIADTSKPNHQIHPVYHAIFNSVTRLEEMSAKLSVWGELLPFMETGTVVDLDQLAKRRRAAVQPIYRMTTFGCELYKQLDFDPNFVTNINQTFRMRKTMMDLKRNLSKPLS